MITYSFLLSAWIYNNDNLSFLNSKSSHYRARWCCKCTAHLCISYSTISICIVALQTKFLDFIEWKACSLWGATWCTLHLIANACIDRNWLGWVNSMLLLKEGHFFCTDVLVKALQVIENAAINCKRLSTESLILPCCSVNLQWLLPYQSSLVALSHSEWWAFAKSSDQTESNRLGPSTWYTRCSSGCE